MESHVERHKKHAALVESIVKTSVARRKMRSLLPASRPESQVPPRALFLLAMRAEYEEVPRFPRAQLLVMLKDGSKIPAGSIYEWVQQHCVEQCAVLIEMREQSYDVDDYRMGTRVSCCALAFADGYEVPTFMSCAHWWESTELYQNLIDTRRQSELEYRTLIVAITKMQKENLVPTSISFEFLLTTIKELLVPNLTTIRFLAKRRTLELG